MSITEYQIKGAFSRFYRTEITDIATKALFGKPCRITTVEKPEYNAFSIQGESRLHVVHVNEEDLFTAILKYGDIDMAYVAALLRAADIEIDSRKLRSYNTAHIYEQVDKLMKERETNVE
jgi:hypothetical protein